MVISQLRALFLIVVYKKNLTVINEIVWGGDDESQQEWKSQLDFKSLLWFIVNWKTLPVSQTI